MSSPIDIEIADVRHLPEFMALVADVAWPHTSEDVSSSLLLGRPWRAINRDSGATIGVAVWWPMGHDYGRVGLVIVSPNFQGYGIGRAIDAESDGRCSKERAHLCCWRQRRANRSMINLASKACVNATHYSHALDDCVRYCRRIIVRRVR